MSHSPYSIDQNFWGLLLDHQKDALRTYNALPQILNGGVQRKGWESKYDPRFTKGSGFSPTSPLTGPETLPKNRWVALRKSNLPEGFKSEREDIRPWAKAQRMKYHLTWVRIDNIETQVFVFKKAKDAMLFKLTWG